MRPTGDTVIILFKCLVLRSNFPEAPGATSIVLIALSFVESRSSEFVSMLLGRTIVSISFLFVLNEILIFVDGYPMSELDLYAPPPPEFFR